MARRALNPAFAVITGLDWEAASFRRGAFGGFQGRVHAAGIGAAAARSAAQRSVGQGARALVSWGSAAGLGNLRSGTLLVTSSICDADGRPIPVRTFDREALRSVIVAIRDVSTGLVVGVDEPLFSPDGKRELARRTGAQAADMESHALAEVAREHDLPLLVCRVIVDAVDMSVPPMVLAALSGSRARIGPVLTGLARNPGELTAICRLGVAAFRGQRRLKRLASGMAPMLSAAVNPMEKSNE